MFHKILGNSWAALRMLASEDGFSSLELGRRFWLPKCIWKLRAMSSGQFLLLAWSERELLATEPQMCLLCLLCLAPAMWRPLDWYKVTNVRRPLQWMQRTRLNLVNFMLQCTSSHLNRLVQRWWSWLQYQRWSVRISTDSGYPDSDISCFSSFPPKMPGYYPGQAKIASFQTLFKFVIYKMVAQSIWRLAKGLMTEESEFESQ
jgi:hypothetical protein